MTASVAKHFRSPIQPNKVLMGIKEMGLYDSLPRSLCSVLGKSEIGISFCFSFSFTILLDHFESGSQNLMNMASHVLVASRMGYGV